MMKFFQNFSGPVAEEKSAGDELYYCGRDQCTIKFKVLLETCARLVYMLKE